MVMIVMAYSLVSNTKHTGIRDTAFKGHNSVIFLLHLNGIYGISCHGALEVSLVVRGKYFGTDYETFPL